jgi:DNA polymerase elongation subunit (family B)
MNDKPIIIAFDLETLPDMEAVRPRFFGISQWPGKSMGPDMNSIISFGFKYLDSDQPADCIQVSDLDPNWAKNPNDDSALCHVIYETLMEADGLTTHNGLKFDIPVLNARFSKYGLPPLPRMPHFDTCNVAKRKFRLSSASLENVADHLGLGSKMSHSGKKLWEDFAAGCPRAAKTMKEYCIQDVELQASVADALRPYTNKIPNYTIFSEETGQRQCPVCGGLGRQKSKGWHSTGTNRYPRRQCGHCGTTYRSDKKDQKPRAIG